MEIKQGSITAISRVLSTQLLRIRIKCSDGKKLCADLTDMQANLARKAIGDSLDKPGREIRIKKDDESLTWLGHISEDRWSAIDEPKPYGKIYKNTRTR